MSSKLNPSDKQYSSNNTQNNAMSNNQDLLDLLGGIDTIPTTTTTPSTINPLNDNLNTTNGNSILSMLPSTLSPMSGNILNNSLFDDLTSNNTTTNNSTSFGGMKLTALDKNGLNVTLVPSKNGDGANDGCLRIVMLATNNSLNTLEQYLFQAAVPKSFTLQMLSPSGSVLPPGGTISQEMRLTSSSKVNLAKIQNSDLVLNSFLFVISCRVC